MIIVDPNAKLDGSTSVACWVLEFVNGSALNFTRGVVAGGKFEPEPLEPLFDGRKGLEPEPQLKLTASAHAAEKHLTADFTDLPFRPRTAVPTTYRLFSPASMPV